MPRIGLLQLGLTIQTPLATMGNSASTPSKIVLAYFDIEAVAEKVRLVFVMTGAACRSLLKTSAATYSHRFACFWPSERLEKA